MYWRWTDRTHRHAAVWQAFCLTWQPVQQRTRSGRNHVPACRKQSRWIPAARNSPASWKLWKVPKSPAGEPSPGKMQLRNWRVCWHATRNTRGQTCCTSLPCCITGRQLPWNPAVHIPKNGMNTGPVHWHTGRLSLKRTPTGRAGWQPAKLFMNRKYRRMNLKNSATKPSGAGCGKSTSSMRQPTPQKSKTRMPPGTAAGWHNGTWKSMPPTR